MLVSLIWIAVIVVTVVVFHRNMRHIVTRCPRCGSVLECDPYRYKGVVVWTCDGCGGHFETMKTKD